MRTFSISQFQGILTRLTYSHSAKDVQPQGVVAQRQATHKREKLHKGGGYNKRAFAQGKGPFLVDSSVRRYSAVVV